MAINDQEFIENAGEVRWAHSDEFKGNGYNFMSTMRLLSSVMIPTDSCSPAGMIRAHAGVGHPWGVDRPWTTGSHHRPVIPPWDFIRATVPF